MQRIGEDVVRKLDYPPGVVIDERLICVTWVAGSSDSQTGRQCGEVKRASMTGLRRAPGVRQPRSTD